MSTLTEAKGGDGWSSWAVKRQRDGRFSVVVTSKAEKTARGIGRSVYSSDTNGFATAQEAIAHAESEASAYAYRMYQ